MPLIEPVIRPPAEAFSFLVQLTCGCSSNTCSFCGAYLNKPFRIKPEHEINADIEAGARRFPRTRRVFLLDGDAFSLETQRLLPVLRHLSCAFPRLARVAAYANDYSVLGKSDEELQQLAANRLRLLYIGLESGAQSILDACHKRSTVAGMIEAVHRAAAAGIKSSVIVLLGLGGKLDSAQHVAETVAALNRMQPRLLSFLSLMLIPGTELHGRAEQGEFQELGSRELLQECRDMIAGLELQSTVFRSDHASNYLPLEGRFPQDKQRLLDTLDQALAGHQTLRPEYFRGL